MDNGQGVVMAAPSSKSRGHSAGRSSKNVPSRTVVSKTTSECWLDIYEAPFFGGRLRRVYGPGTFRRGVRAGSLVVGPNARIMPIAKGETTALYPKQLVADLAKSGLAEKLAHFEVVYAETGAEK
jgi:hypothetical protein